MNLNKHMLSILFLPNWVKNISLYIFDSFLCFLTCWLAFSIINQKLLYPDYPFYKTFIVSISIALVVFNLSGLYRIKFRYNNYTASSHPFFGILIYSIFFISILYILQLDSVPLSISYIQPLLLTIFLYISRYAINRIIIRFMARSTRPYGRINALIYGAGSAGRQLAAGLIHGSEYLPCAFIDDDPKLIGKIINGLSVYGTDMINRLIQRAKIKIVLIALPSITQSRRKDILNMLSVMPVKVRTVPGLSDLVGGIVKIEDLRTIDVEDLLGREPVKPNDNLMHENISEKVVLITGAGGSIGSEICRQAASLSPGKLVLFELNEYALYNIEREISAIQPNLPVISILGSVLDRRLLQSVFKKHNIQTVFHAAAYKHVPMIEENLVSGVLNNVFGTLHCVDTSIEYGVETFVLISTDKAVRPTNVMGCSKRISELILQSKNFYCSSDNDFKTKLTMVRFGNVLGSSGSVVPLFKEQIARGGPLTVTHPEIIRYFMTIPEAAQLVIQAGAVGKGGDVMVLDMGEPIKIFDLAKKMINLSGLSLAHDGNRDGIHIKFTGLRPGEKLYEELLICRNTLPTFHERILRASEPYLKWNELEPLLASLYNAVEKFDENKIKELLITLVPEYQPERIV